MRATLGQIRAFLAANPYTAVATQRLSARARAESRCVAAAVYGFVSRNRRI